MGKSFVSVESAEVNALVQAAIVLVNKNDSIAPRVLARCNGSSGQHV